MKDTKEQLTKEIERLYNKWSTSGLSSYEKLALKKLEKKWKEVK